MNKGKKQKQEEIWARIYQASQSAILVLSAENSWIYSYFQT